MGRRLTRKEIKKKDPVTDILQKIWSFCLENKKLATIAVAAVLGAIVIYMVGDMVYTRSAASRSVAMKQAMTTFNAKVDPAQKEPGENVFTTNAAKYTAALASFTKVESELGSSGEGLFASYYKGLCLRELGRYPEAEATLKKVVEQMDEGRLKQIALLGLAETLRAQKKYDEAIQRFTELEKMAGTVVPFEAVCYSKALCLEEKGKVKEAYDLVQATYKTIQEKKREQYQTPYEAQISSLMARLKAKLLATGVAVS